MNIDVFVSSLSVMGWGMLGIFVVMGTICLSIVALRKVFSVVNDGKGDGKA